MRRLILSFLAVLLLAVAAPARASDQQEIVDRAKLVVDRLRRDDNMSKNLNALLGRAKAVIIAPTLWRGGFFFGGSGGSAVLLTRGQDGSWSAPAFYGMGGGSFGLQIGAEGGKVMFAIMNDGAVHKLLNGNVNLGGDVSVAVGPIGAGAQGAVTPNVGADLLAFSLQQGLFGGIAFKGGTVTGNKEWNQAFYGPEATPDRIIRAGYARPETRPLKSALAMSPPRRTGSAR